jgi:hypothetical protein
MRLRAVTILTMMALVVAVVMLGSAGIAAQGAASAARAAAGRRSKEPGSKRRGRSKIPSRWKKAFPKTTRRSLARGP